MRTTDRLAPMLISLGATGVLVATFRPWVASGRRTRNSYEVFEIVERLGFAPGGLVGWAMRLWPLVPLLLATAVATTWFERRLVAGVAAALAALYAGGVGVAVNTAPHEGIVRVVGAPLFTAIAALVLVSGAIAELAGVVLARRGPHPTPALASRPRDRRPGTPGSDRTSERTSDRA